MKAVHIVGDHAEAERAVAGDVLAARHTRRQASKISFDEQIQRQTRRRAAHPFPSKRRPHDPSEARQRGGVAHQCVKPGRQAVHPMDEQP